MTKTPLRFTLSMAREKFDRKMQKALNSAMLFSGDVVKEASNMFLQSVVKATPQAKAKKRDFRMRTSTTLSYNKRDNEWQRTAGAPMMAVVFWRRPLRGAEQARGKWYFGTGGEWVWSRVINGWKFMPKNAAKQKGPVGNYRKYLPITNRGIGKAAWIFSGEKIGVIPKTSFKPKPSMRSVANEIAKGVMGKSYMRVFAELTNKARGIHRYGERAAINALRRAGNRIARWASIEEAKRRRFVGI